MLKITIGFVVTVAAALAVLIAAGALDTAETEADLRVSWGPEPESVDPAVVTGVVENRYIHALFEGLVTFGPDHLTPEPGVASEIRTSPDGRVYTFPIRPDARWSNGRAVAAEDFVWAWRRILECRVKCDYAYMLYYIEGAEAYHLQNLSEVVLKSLAGMETREKRDTVKTVLLPGARAPQAERIRALADPATEPDPSLRGALLAAADAARGRPPVRFDDVGVRICPGNVLEVTLVNAVPFILDIFAFGTLMPVPREAVEAHGEDWIKPGRIVCNGAFVLEQWRPHYAIVLRKNPHYRGAESVRLERVLSRVLEGGSTGLNYYERGMLDFVDRSVVPQDFIAPLRSRPDFRTFVSFGSYFLRFNTTRPPFDDPRVRRAFAMAVDKRAVVAVLQGGEQPTDRVVPPCAGYEDVQPAGLAFDPAAARRLLDAAWPDRAAMPRIEYLMRDTPKQKDVYNVIRGQLERHLGVTIDAKGQEWQIYLDTMNNLDFGLAYGGWSADYADPTTFLDMWVTGGGNNRTGWSDPEYDRWLRESLAEPDPARRNAILARCERRVLEEACILLPLYVPLEYVMLKPWMKGFPEENPMDRFLLRHFRVER